MKCRHAGLLVSSVVSTFVLSSALSASAANGTWNSTAQGSNGFWTNSLNWSVSPYPSGGDTALFNNDGNGQQELDLAGLSFIKYITYDSPLVAAYTNGTGAANSQTLVMADGGEIRLTSTAGSSQFFNCGLQLGPDRTGQSYSFRNDSLSQSLIFSDIFGCAPEFSGGAGTKTLNLSGSGPVSILGNIQPNGASGLVLNHTINNTLTLTGSNMITTLNMYGGPNSVVDIGNKELFLNSGGGTTLQCTLGGTINGTGKLRMGTTDGFTSTGYNYADLYVFGGKTLVINPEITGKGGIEIWQPSGGVGTGTYVLNNTNNSFEGHIIFGVAATISCPCIGNRGSVTSSLGQGTNIYFSAGGKLLYTGTGEDSNRQIILNNNAAIEQSGPGGKLTFNVSPSVASSGTKTLTLQGSTSAVGEFSAPLVNSSGTLAITKAGEGTWILSRTNTYTGATTVNGGKLLVNSPGELASGSAVAVNSAAVLGGSGSIKGGVTVNAGGMLAPGDVNAAATLALGGALTLNSGTLLFDVSNVSTDKVTVAGTLTVNGTNTVVVNFPVGALPSGTYTLMTNTGSRAGTGSFVLSPAYVNASLVTNASSLKLVVVDTGAYGLKWKGDVSENWDGTDLNWTNGSDAVVFAPGDAVAFDDAASRFTVASLSASPVLPGAVFFNNSISNYAVSASIDGTGVVYKLGSGTVTLSGSNAYTGQTTIVAGTLAIGGSGVLGGGNYATNLINNGALNYASSAAQTNSGVISGGGSLTVSGNGTLTLSGNNTYVGLTVVTSSVLRVQNANALGSTAAGTVVAPGAKLELLGSNIVFAAEPLDLRGTLAYAAGSNTFSGAVSLQDGATIDIGATAQLNLSTTTPDTGSNMVTKTGLGTLRFTGDPNHRSVFVVGEGVVELQHGGSTDAPWFINPGATLRDLTATALGDFFVQANGILDLRVSEGIGGLSGGTSGLVTNGSSSAITLTVGNNNQSGSFDGVIRNGAGTLALTKAGSGVQILSGANTYSAGTTLSGGQLHINNASAIGTGLFTIGGDYTIDNSSGSDIVMSANNAQNWNGNFTFLGGRSLNLGTGAVTMNANRTVTVLTNTLAVGGAIGGSYALTKNGVGTLALSGVNTYSGATTVNGGSLFVNSPGSLASGSAVTVNGCTLGGSGTINGTVTLAAGSLLVPGGFNAVGTLTLANNSASALTLNASTLLFDLSTVAGTCDKINISAASGKLVLNGTNTIALTLPAGGAPAGAYTLMTCTGGITTNAGAALLLQGAYPNATLGMVGNNVVLTLATGGISGVTWTGAASGAWDGADPDLNWTNGIAAVAFTTGDAVTFDDSALDNFTVSSGSGVSPSVVSFNNSANDYFVSAAINGTAPLIKQGSACVSLSGVSTYNPSSLSINNGTLTLGGASQLNSGTYAGNILNNGMLDYASSAAQLCSGLLSGVGVLKTSGPGTLILSGSNFYSGATLVNSGVLKIQHAYALGATASGTTVALGGNLELAGNISTLSEVLTLNGALSSQTGTNTFNGNITLNAGASIDVGTGSMLILKAFQANGPFTKTGSGWLKFTTDPNGNGVMIVNDGVAELNQSGGAMDANVLVNAGGTLLGNTGDGINGANRVTVNSGGSYVIQQNDTINALSGAGTVTRNVTGTGNLTVFNNNNQFDVFSGVIQNGAGTMSFTKGGLGTFTLTGVNTYSGSTLVNGGSLFINSPGSLAAGSAVTVYNSATLGGNGTINGPVTATAPGSLVPGGLNAIGTLTLGSTLALTGNTLLFDVPASGTTCDRIAVAGPLILNGVNGVVLSFPAGATPEGDYTLMTFASHVGPGSFVLAGNYPNASLVLNGTSLVLSVSGGSTSVLTWNGNLSAYWDGGVQNWKAGSVATSYTSGDSVVFDDSAAQLTVVSGGAVAPSSLVFNNNNVVTPYVVAAAVGGTAPVLKYGAGTAFLNGVSTYNPSSITVNAGTLALGVASRLNSGNYAGPIYNSGVYNHNSTSAQILSGLVTGPGSVNKNGTGDLTLSSTNNYSGGTTLSSGTLYGKSSTSVSPFGTGGLTLNTASTILELQSDAGLAFNNAATVNASMTVKPNRLTPGLGVTHTLGALTIYGVTLSVTNGANVNANSPYGLTFGTTTLGASTPTFNVANNGAGVGTLTLGQLVNNYSITKANNGTLVLGTAGNGNRNSAGTTLTAGTLRLGHAGALGTSGATLQLNGGILDLAIDTTISAHNTTVGGNTTVQSDKATFNSAGITHTLGTLSMGAYTLTVTNGPGVLASSPFGLTFGTTTLTGASVFDVGNNNGTGFGTLTLQGVVSGSNPLTKRGSGILKLTGVNTYSGATTVNNGKLLGVVGGSCAGTITVQSSGIASAVAKLGVLCNAANGSWVCTNLTVSAAGAPATTNPVLEFAFSVTPSTTVAPLRVNGTATFNATPGVTVNLSNLGTVPAGTYPLMLVGGTAPATTPALTMINGYSGSSLSWSGNTLNLNLTGTPTAPNLTWNTGAAGNGTWDINSSANLVWKDSADSAAFYSEPTEVGGVGSRVLFDNMSISADTTVSLNSYVTPTSVAFTNTAFSYTLTGGGGMAGSFALTKAGSNTLTLATANTYTGGTVVADGTLKLASGGSINHAGGDLVVANTMLTNALLKIESGAAVSGKWLMLGTTNGAVGAIHNRGTLVVAGAANVTNFALGFSTNSYGYYRHDTAIPLTMFETGIASANGGNGVFDVLQGAVTNSTYFQLNRGAVQQYSQVNVTGGRLVMPNSNANAHFFYAGSGQAVINVSGGGLLGSAGTGTELDLIKNSTSTSANGILNILSGGTVQATKVKASQGNGTALVNFNGGTFKANNNGFLMLGGSNIDRATVYTQGLTVDTDGRSATISQALLAPAGNGVTSIPVIGNGTGYIGRPVVTISGGGGVGATAVADYDPDSQEVTGITITSPGYNYTSAPAVAFSGGGGIAPTLGTVSIGPVSSGSLTKIGNGLLTLAGVNTYTGETTISNGTVRLGVVNALPTNAVVNVVGGTLDLNGFTVTNGSINLISGSIVNGKVLAPTLQAADTGLLQAQIISTNGLIKNGSGTLMIVVPQAYAGATVINGGTLLLAGKPAGLSEGRVSGSFELNTANPKTAVPLSTRYANVFFNANGESGNIWVDNSTYVYTGYLWNDSSNDETWTFYKGFDDSARLLVNGVNVLQNNVSSAQVISNATVKAGWNTFELRLGQGTGGVGNNQASFPNMGIGYDRLGRNQLIYANFKTLADPGDGSLLTVTNVFDLSNANLLPTGSVVTVASGAVLDLGGTGQKVGGLIGSGLVSNGTLAVNGLIAPGGLNATGTLTLAASSTLAGTLRVDVSDDGPCDVLSVKGDVSMSGLALVVDNPSQLNPRLQYTIMTCTGFRTGTFSSKSLPAGWIVTYETNGDVKLVYAGGTLFFLK